MNQIYRQHQSGKPQEGPMPWCKPSYRV
eukprot:SAG11_NODE_4430_length_1897_cov_4.359844_2_plen_27_part_01